MNSFRMSFWIVPCSWACGTPCSSAATMNPASTGKTAPFIVADNARMVAVVTAMGGKVEGDRQPHLPRLQVLAVEAVRLLGGREPRILADGPRPVRVHRRPRPAEIGRDAGQCLAPREAGRLD